MVHLTTYSTRINVTYRTVHSTCSHISAFLQEHSGTSSGCGALFTWTQQRPPHTTSHSLLFSTRPLRQDTASPPLILHSALRLFQTFLGRIFPFILMALCIKYYFPVIPNPTDTPSGASRGIQIPGSVYMSCLTWPIKRSQMGLMPFLWGFQLHAIG